MPRSFRHSVCVACRFFLIMTAVVLLCTVPARAGQFSDPELLKPAIRGDFVLEPFNGQDNLLLPAPLLGGANGYAFAVEPASGAFGLTRLASFGVGAQSEPAVLRVRFTGAGLSGKPVTAFGGWMRIMTNALAPTPGRLTVEASDGTSYSFLVSADGTFFALTFSQPIEWFTIDAGVGTGGTSIFEQLDNLYVGSSVIAPVGALSCVDAPTVSTGSFAFTTVGGTLESIAGSCSDMDVGPEVWFRYVPSTSGTVSMQTCGCTFDSILRVFGGCFPYPAVACNDDVCLTAQGTPRASALTFRGNAGDAYMTRVAGYSLAAGSGVLTIAQDEDCRGDFNHSGGLPTVQDIFDFLVAYFATCP